MKFINFKNFKEKKFLITGGLGFVGSNLVSTLLSEGIKPVIIDYISKDMEIDHNFLPFRLEDLELFNVDIRNREELIRVLERITPDYVIHLASMTNLTKDFFHAQISVDVNIKGTLNLLESIHKHDIKGFIFLSTSDVYGDVQPPFRENQVTIPASPYSSSKASAEMYCLMFSRVYNLPVTILRSFNLFGKYQRPVRVLPYIIMELLMGREVKLTAGEQKREFNYIENLIEAIALSFLTPQCHGKIINIGCGKSFSIREVALKIGQKLNLQDLINLGAVPYRPNEIWDMYCDNSRAKTILGWEPRIDLDKGIDRTIKWFQDTFTPEHHEI